MNAMKYEILTIVHNSTSMYPVHRTDLLTDPSVINQRDKCINELITSGYLSQPVCSDILRITAKGVEALEAERERLRLSEEEARKDAKQEKQQRFENKVSVANLLVPLITYILGILTEHYAGIMDFITNLFH